MFKKNDGACDYGNVAISRNVNEHSLCSVTTRAGLSNSVRIFRISYANFQSSYRERRQKEKTDYQRGQSHRRRFIRVYDERRQNRSGTHHQM